MEEIVSSPSSTTSAALEDKRRHDTSASSRVKKGCLSFLASLQEGFTYVKALFLGQAKKMTAQNEKQAAAAELEAEKLQVKAADEAESTKKKLDKSL